MIGRDAWLNYGSAFWGGGRCGLGRKQGDECMALSSTRSGVVPRPADLTSPGKLPAWLHDDFEIGSVIAIVPVFVMDAKPRSGVTCPASTFLAKLIEPCSREVRNGCIRIAHCLRLRRTTSG